MRLALNDIVMATGGTLLRGDRHTIIERVSTDTRVLRPGDLFVAITGERFDGNAFAVRALAAGAQGVICTDDAIREGLPGEGFVLLVEDGTEALGAIGREWRRKLGLMVVGLTGSTGKTTTKELAAHLCEGSVPVFATEGNKNNHVGLPLMLARLSEEHAAAILEMGMNHAGEIAYLVNIAEPEIGLLTNIGDAHLGNFANHDALTAAKAELFTTMQPGGTALINCDCPHIAKILPAIAARHKTVLFGEGKQAHVRARNIEAEKPFGYRFELLVNGRGVPVYLPVFGRYQIANALGAVAVAIELGVPLEDAVDRLATFTAPEMRSRIQNIEGVRIIEDCYNASPSAVESALASLGQIAGRGRRYTLLGDMNELGGFAEACHRRVGRAAASAKLDGIFTVGDLSVWITSEALDREASARHFDSIEEAAEHLAGILRADDAVLVKGSRIARLERAIDFLRAGLLGRARKGVVV
ncbi:MAG: UDP-N-acetylmuramoyl-tripeptide--D-alanyl-D-alanine ligase [Candidatus Sumerlaeota bacterium]|nr:UDP-N-acetylmuramoyl-tripeptide--D-alanyl-D-alanine ligase [Candidatus Sumerlaeota bacterium]